MRDSIVVKRKTIQVIVILVVLIVLIGVVVMLLRPSADVVATVNGEEITLNEFNLLYDRIVLFNPDIPKEQIVDQLISNKILLQEAKRQGLTVEEKEIEAVISLTESLYGKSIQELLVNSSVSFETFKSKLEEQLLMSKLLNQTIKVEEPTDQELRQLYVNNSHLFQVPEGLNVSHILVKTEEEAEEIKSQLGKGADFYQLASEKSIDPSAKMNAGNLGPIQRGATVKEFEDVAFSLKEGIISDPVQSQFGYHFIKVENRVAGRKLSFAEVKDQLKTMATQQKQQEAITKYAASLTNKAKVRKYFDRL